MQILVANPTHQHIEFHFRVPEYQKIFSTLVPAGRQMALPVDCNDLQMQAIVTQLERIGAVPASDVASLSSPRGLIYSTRKPIPAEKIDAGRERDEEIRQQIADQKTEEAGIASAFIQGHTSDGMQSSTLEVQELQPTTREERVKGGVDTRVTVSKRAGPKERKRG